MKILSVIVTDNPKLLKKTVSWCSRAGFDLKIFVSSNKQMAAFENAIDQANYDDYLDIKYDMLVVGDKPKSYARENGYDLLLTIPEGLYAWKRGVSKDRMIIDYAVDVGKARVSFSEDPKKKTHRFKNNAIMFKL